MQDARSASVQQEYSQGAISVIDPRGEFLSIPRLRCCSCWYSRMLASGPVLIILASCLNVCAWLCWQGLHLRIETKVVEILGPMIRARGKWRSSWLASQVRFSLMRRCSIESQSDKIN
jgi:hypothetical protein